MKIWQYIITIIALLIVLMCIVVLTVEQKNIQKQHEINTAIDTSLQAQTKEEDCESADTEYRKQLIEWVFTHSTRTSRKDAAEIIDACLLLSKRPMLLLALFRTESAFDRNSLSSANAIGLGQITKVHEKDLREKSIIKKDLRELNNIYTNVTASDYVLEKYLQMSNGKISKALKRYHSLNATNNGEYIEKIFNDYYQLTMLKRSKQCHDIYH